jgi:hypothetical protein
MADWKSKAYKAQYARDKYHAMSPEERKAANQHRVFRHVELNYDGDYEAYKADRKIKRQAFRERKKNSGDYETYKADQRLKKQAYRKRKKNGEKN